VDERDFDAMLEAVFEQERADLVRQHGEQLLSILQGDASKAGGASPADALIGLFNQAWRTKLEEQEGKSEQ